MNILDSVYIAALSFFLVTGIFRGFTNEVISIIALVVAFFLANTFYSLPASFLDLDLKNPSVANILGYAAVFIVVIIIVNLIGAAVRFFIKAAPLKLIDRVGGAAVGLVKGILVCLIITLLLIVFPVRPGRGQMSDSVLAKNAASLCRVLIIAAPRKMKNRFESGYDTLTKRDAVKPKELLKDAADAVKR